MNLNTLFATRYLPHVRRALKPRTVAEYERLAEQCILPKLGGREIGRLTLDAIETWHADVPGRVQANRALAVLSGALTFAVKRRLLGANPCHGVVLNKERGREFFYSPDQTKAILNTALSWPDIRGKYIALCLLTGCRPGELVDLAPAWRSAGAVRTPDGKTGGRIIFLSGSAEAILDGLPPVHGRNGKPGVCYFPEGMYLPRVWEAICKAAGVPRARLYDLRHTFASAALAGDAGLDVIGLMLGHRKRETTLRYAHLAPDIGVNAASVAARRMEMKT